MTNDSQSPANPITISPSAAVILKAAVDSSSPGAAVVRFAVVRDDDAFAHQVTLEESPVADDLVFEQHGVTMAVAPDQVPVLVGAHFDIQVEAGEPRLVVSNPNLPAA